MLAGPSGVGKGAIVARLLAALPDLELSISATTRQPRPREDEGRHYHFVDRANFDEMVEAGLDAGSSLVARGVRGRGGRGRGQGGGQGNGEDAGAGASEQLSHASPFVGGG